jgi:hypothetical protein
MALANACLAASELSPAKWTKMFEGREYEAKSIGISFDFLILPPVLGGNEADRADDEGACKMSASHDTVLSMLFVIRF